MKVIPVPDDIFLDRVMPEPNTGCWLWCGPHDKHGYGMSSSIRAHRVMYTHLIGPIPEGLDLDHLCRMPACVNPRHLEPVTRRENSLRGFGILAINARKTHCKRGHKFTDGNTIKRTSQSGYPARECRECSKIKEASRPKRKRNRKSTCTEHFARARLEKRGVWQLISVKATSKAQCILAERMAGLHGGFRAAENQPPAFRNPKALPYRRGFRFTFDPMHYSSPASRVVAAITRAAWSAAVRLWFITRGWW